MVSSLQALRSNGLHSLKNQSYKNNAFNGHFVARNMAERVAAIPKLQSTQVQVGTTS